MSSEKKLTICEVCAKVEAKYTCPKCEVRTCSSSCVNIHKKELECDGIRDKTKFIPLKSFTDLDMLSDIRLLENVGRVLDQSHKNSSKKFTRENYQMPVHLSKLQKAANHRGVKLNFMPRDFSRHKENTTYYKWKENELFWKIEFIFPQAENVKWIVDRVIDTTKLSDLLEEIINFNYDTESKSDESKSKLSVLQSKLKFYRSCGLTGLKVLLKADNVKKSNSSFYELDITQTIQENLKNKTVIEHPFIYVVLKDHDHMFEIIDSDEEMEEETLLPEVKRKKFDTNSKANKNEKKETSSNYFFNGDLSDSDDESTTNNYCDNKKKHKLHIPNYDELVKTRN